MNLACLRSRIGIFQEGDPPRSVPTSPRRKKQRNCGGSLSGMSGAQRPHTPLSLQRLTPPVCFIGRAPSLDVSGLVSLGASEDETVSLTASDADEWACSGEEPEAPPLSHLQNQRSLSSRKSQGFSRKLNSLKDSSQLFPTPSNSSKWWRCFNRARPVNSVCAPNYCCDSRPTYNKDQISSPYTHTCQFSACGRRTVISKACRTCLFSPFGQRAVITKDKDTHEGQFPARVSCPR
ncbi:hypothetical protein G5714_020873 [Onychostoma macrolepis]|uniref:Uncharacterized protein n=1 Tax=Onychostoma macrolepis TaxID=369639 RepID=A0A7J6BWG0_9TELE|nr:hypothetical protein G5714_020873 [Onychostoma macrolepis]